jgi:ArsR family transcriptional regulator, arsenate/arsenite/antimonite-responsive transcriptional repressor
MKKADPNDLLKAFADETRLRILNLLSGGELCVCDIMSVIKAPQPKISRHLATLRRHGLVDTKREGQWIYYSLSKPTGRFHKRLLACLDDCLEEAPVFFRDKKTLSGLDCRKSGCC